MALKVGDKAPEFNLKDSFEKDVSLKSLRETSFSKESFNLNSGALSPTLRAIEIIK